MNDELAWFLRARLDETERDAREASGDEAHQRWALDESPDYNEGAIVSNALWHLRDVEAKRRILEICVGPYTDDGEEVMGSQILGLLALPYADDPGYREEWRP